MKDYQGRVLRVEPLENRYLLTTISNGQQISGALGVGVTDSYQLSADNGDYVQVSVGQTLNGVGEPRLTVLTQGGQVVASLNGANDNAVVQFTAIQSGVYTVQVSDAGNNESLNYYVRAVSVPDTPQLIGGRDSTLSNGQEVTTSLPLGSFNLHTFSADNGDFVQISVGQAVNGGGEPRLTILTPGGQVAATPSSSLDSSVVQFEAVQSGTYTILVADGSNNATLGYYVRAITVPDVPQFIPGRDSALSNGQEATTSLASGSFNVHTISADNGDFVQVAVGQSFNADGQPRLTVLTPGGQVVASLVGSNDNAVVQFTAIQSGAYSILVSDGSDNESLAYYIRAIAIPNIPQLIAGRDSALSNGQAATTSLPLGSFNVHTFSANNGDVVQVTVDQTAGAAGQPRLSVLTPGGQVAAGPTGANDNATVQFTAVQSGIYTALVSDGGSNEAISYTIQGTGILAPQFPVGDYNRSGSVEQSDYTLWRATYGQTVATGAAADGNQNQLIDAADFVVWRKASSAAGLGLSTSDAASNASIANGAEPSNPSDNGASSVASMAKERNDTLNETYQSLENVSQFHAAELANVFGEHLGTSNNAIGHNIRREYSNALDDNGKQLLGLLASNRVDEQIETMPFDDSRYDQKQIAEVDRIFARIGGSGFTSRLKGVDQGLIWSGI